MTLEGIYFISQILAAIAIVASLIFVVLQLRQSDRTQRAMMHQLRAQRGMDLAINAAEPTLMAAMGRVMRSDPNTSPDDIVRAASVMRALILNLDDTVWQHSAALLSDDAVATTAGVMRQMFAFPGLRALWLMFHSTFGRETADIVDKTIIANTPVAEPGDIVAVWRMLAGQLRPASGAS